MDPKRWMDLHGYNENDLIIARQVLAEIRAGRDVFTAVRRYPLKGGGYLGKHVLVAAYRQLVAGGEWPADEALLASLRTKPVRTLSGVSTVTVLTKPYPCPGRCVFCPTDDRMPKSYLPDEPGAARAFQNQFDPYEQVRSRIDSLEANGHPTDKVELLILGGTWSAYRRDYQAWFVQRCLDAMNECVSSSLEDAQTINETAQHRNVGLVIETRPDEITVEELVNLRRLGVTKVQMGAQSLDDHVLSLNQRGHTAADTRRAVALLRAAGFKIVLHWMPNLLGATLDSDRQDFARLWQEGYCPDEIKIYPTQLLETAELYQYWQRGEYQPYSTEELVQLIADFKTTIPPYCRVNRVIRDIPSPHVVAGNRRTSLRQDALAELARRGVSCQCIRCREVRGQSFDPSALFLDDIVYTPVGAEEHFLQFITPSNQIAGYLRLSLPQDKTGLGLPALGIEDLEQAALVREVHVFGQSLPVGEEQAGAAQHIGLGTRLLKRAEEIANQNGYKKLTVISAIGTRNYYQNRGFERGELYLVKPL
jgi:elongator complex protein 3